MSLHPRKVGADNTREFVGADISVAVLSAVLG